jgi:hypothetical protein
MARAEPPFLPCTLANITAQAKRACIFGLGPYLIKRGTIGGKALCAHVLAPFDWNQCLADII